MLAGSQVSRFPGAAQGTGRRRRRTHPHQQGPPWLHRREVRCSGGRPVRDRTEQYIETQVKFEDGYRSVSATLKLSWTPDFCPSRAPPEPPSAMSTKDRRRHPRRQNINRGSVRWRRRPTSPFNVKDNEIRPSSAQRGAGHKSPCSTVSTGYTPSEGSITFRGKTLTT